MDSKKRVGILITLLVISVVISGFVSAGWLSDLLGFGEDDEGLEGELATEQAEAWLNISPSAAAGEVVFVSNPRPEAVSGGDGYVDLIINESKEFTFSFVVTHPTGETTQLPDDGEEDVDDGDITPFVMANFSRSGEALRDKNDYPGIEDCQYVGRISDYLGMGPAKNYTCTVNMSFYDDPDDWRISVQIETVQGIISDVNDTNLFRPNKILDLVIYPRIVNWSSLTIGDTNTEADYTLTIENIGNVDISDVSGGGNSYMQLNATTLLGATDPSDTINGGNFTADEDDGTPCAQTVFKVADWEELHLAVDHDLSAEGDPWDEPLMFCLNQIPTGNAPQAYASDGLWSIETVLV